MIVQARWVDPAVTHGKRHPEPSDLAPMLAASKFIAAAEVKDGAAASAWLAEVVPQHAAECPPGYVAVVCIAGSPWFDPNA